MANPDAHVLVAEPQRVANSGDAADLSDPDSDGIINPIEFATGFNDRRFVRLRVTRP